MKFGSILAALLCLFPLLAAADADRSGQTIGISGEMGWNGLVGGIGPTLHYYLENAALDAGTGIAATGFKFGGRVRYLFKANKKTSPFVGAGINYGSGLSGMPVTTNGSSDTLVVDARPSAFFQGSVGLDYRAHNGFMFLAGLGYAFDLTEGQFDVVSGTVTGTKKKFLDIMLGSGVSFSLAFGYSFGSR